jgi:hypothetical protein
VIGSWDLQVAIYDALKLAGITAGRVHDESAAPVNVQFPFVAIGATEATNIDAVGIDGIDELLTLHIWDRSNAEGGQRGMKQIKQVGDQIHTLLNGKRLHVEGRDSAFCIVRGFTPVAEGDPLTSHGALTVRVQHYKKHD